MSFLLDFFFPRRCLGCGRLGSYFCKDCQLIHLPPDWPICPHCGERSVLGITHLSCRRHDQLDGLSVLFRYHGLMKKTIKELKYRLVTDLAAEFTGQCFARWQAGEGDLFPVLDRSWTLVPVPLHPRRERERGFNQAALIGERLAFLEGWEYDTSLVRLRRTIPQSSLEGKKEKLVNISGAFALVEDIKIKGKKIILFDDIWTSGSTLQEGCRVLKKAGAAKVWGLALAR